jgi:hypothetical protein
VLAAVAFPASYMPSVPRDHAVMRTVCMSRIEIGIHWLVHASKLIEFAECSEVVAGKGDTANLIAFLPA